MRDAWHVTEEDEGAVGVGRQGSDTRLEAGGHTRCEVGRMDEAQPGALLSLVSEINHRAFYIRVGAGDDAYRSDRGGKGCCHRPVEQHASTPGRGKLAAAETRSGAGRKDYGFQPRRSVPLCRHPRFPPMYVRQ